MSQRVTISAGYYSVGDGIRQRIVSGDVIRVSPGHEVWLEGWRVTFDERGNMCLTAPDNVVK